MVDLIVLYPFLQKNETNATLLTASKTTLSHPAVVQMYMYITVFFNHDDDIYLIVVFFIFSQFNNT